MNTEDTKATPYQSAGGKIGNMYGQALQPQRPVREGGLHQRLMELLKLTEEGHRLMSQVEHSMGASRSGQIGTDKSPEVRTTSVESLVSEIATNLSGLIQRLSAHESSF